MAIVGGGCAGLSAAWQLAKQPNYEIHLYEGSWRLGGKGASVRAEDGRILEHGLHLWLGCYENAFRMMRECYAQVERRSWGPDAREADGRLMHGCMDDAFLAEPHVGVAIPRPTGWTAWSGLFPPENGLPGEPLDPGSNPFTLASYLLRCLNLLKTLMHSVIARPSQDAPGYLRPDQRSRADDELEFNLVLDAAQSAPMVIERMAQILRTGTLTGAAVILQAVTIIEIALQQLNFVRQVNDTILNLMEAIASQTRKLLKDVVAVDQDVRTKTEIIDLVLTIAVGLFRDRVLLDERGLDAINQFDYREWLLLHGATRSCVESPFLKGIYDFVFAYRGGQKDRPDLAAGVALRGALRMFLTYRGSMFWHLRSGMGDTVFAPLYRVLQTGTRVDAEGNETKVSSVQFHLCHTLTSVEFSAKGGTQTVASLVFALPGDRALIDAASTRALDRHGRWPDFNQSRFAGGGTSPPVEIHCGEDFDVVVLAIGVDDFRSIVLGRASTRGSTVLRRWQKMCKHITTVGTRSAQVWLYKDLESLGWYRGPGVITALDTTYDTWADMTHTLPSEDFPHRVRSVGYFCGTIPDREIASAQAQPEVLEKEAESDLRTLLECFNVCGVWPMLAEGDVAAAHISVNFKGSERYTQSRPGSLEYRISPLDRTVENLSIAGDWTACGLDAGCVEAATMSGMIAAYALSGTPDPSEIIGYDHP